MENEKAKNPSTYQGNVQNKNQKDLVGRVELWKQKPRGKQPLLRGYIRINTEKLKIDDKGYAYINLSLWESTPHNA